MPQPVSELLQEPIEEVHHREQHALDQLLASREQRVVLFGSGTLGKRALGLLRSLGAEVLAFTDNNEGAWGTSVDGVPVLSPQEAAGKFGKTAAFFVTIWNDHHWYGQTHAKLTALGCDCVSTYSPIYWRFPETFMTLRLLNEPPHRLFADAERVELAEALWADQESLDIYRANIAFRAVGDARELPGPPESSTYFPRELVRLEADDTILDCGAFDGDTIREVLSMRSDGVRGLYAVEADSVSFGRLKQFIEALPAEIGKKIHPMECALAAAPGFIRFECSGSLTSKASDEGVLVECKTIDDLFADQPLSFIKMDIEGAEYEALRGGEKIIRRDQPALAICVYHTQSDIWRIPLLLKEYVPEHRFYLRSYEGDGFQTVLYALPGSRVRDAQRGQA